MIAAIVGMLPHLVSTPQITMLQKIPLGSSGPQPQNTKLDLDYGSDYTKPNSPVCGAAKA